MPHAEPAVDLGISSGGLVELHLTFICGINVGNHNSLLSFTMGTSLAAARRMALESKSFTSSCLNPCTPLP